MFIIGGRKVWLRNTGYSSKGELLEIKDKTAKYAEEGLDILGRKVHPINLRLAQRYREMTLIEFLNYFGMIAKTEKDKE